MVVDITRGDGACELVELTDLDDAATDEARRDYDGMAQAADPSRPRPLNSDLLSAIASLKPYSQDSTDRLKSDRVMRFFAGSRGLIVVAAAGYAVVGLFACVYWIVRVAWPELAPATTATIAALAAAPLALALIWDRLAGLKAFGFEVSLVRVAAPIVAELPGAIGAQQYFSGEEAIVEQITQAIMRPQQELLEVNLGDGDYWWSTRLFLVAALAEDYSQIQLMVFVERVGERLFIGMAPPGDVRHAIAATWPTLEVSYNAIKKRPVTLGVSRLTSIVLAWTAHPFEREGVPKSVKHLTEVDLKVKVDRASIHTWLTTIGRRLATESVDWCGISDPYLIQSLLFDFDSRYVALLRHGQLDRVVSRLDLAVRVARRAT